jgi:hypothetical protein
VKIIAKGWKMEDEILTTEVRIALMKDANTRLDALISKLEKDPDVNKLMVARHEFFNKSG